MEYLVYILAGFGIFSLLVLLIRLIAWCFKCNCDKEFVPIGESAVYTTRNSIINVSINEKEAIQQFDQMLEQYTKPKVVISRQCICPFCTKDPQKIIISNIEERDEQDNFKCISKDQTLVQMDGKTNESSSDFGDTYLEVDDIVIIEDCKEEMPCNSYNNVVLELKNRFSVQNQTQVKKIFDDNQEYP